MTDNQFYLLITVLGTGLAGIGAAIRFSVGRVVKALDLNSAAMLENTRSNAVLSTKIDTIGAYVQGRSRVSSEVKEFIREEISATHEVPIGPDDPTPVEGTRRAKSSPPTPPKGTPILSSGYGPQPGKRKDRP